MREEKVLEVKDLKITFDMERGLVHAVRGVSFALKKGEVLGIVGESGCGKTATVRTIMRLHAGSAHVKSGEILLRNKDARKDGADCGQEIDADEGMTDLLKLSDEEMDEIRGGRIAMILQDPMSSLDPTYSVADQIAEVIMLHGGTAAADETGADEKSADKNGPDKKEAYEKAVELLEMVGIEDAAERAKDHPYAFSGGMRQRVAIAIALAGEPDILICDEPTTALDIGTQGQVMDVIEEMRKRFGLSVIFITHDLGLMRDTADRVLIMKEGLIVEEGPAEEIFNSPREEYTKELLFYADYGKGKDHTHGEIGFRDGLPYHKEAPGRAPLVRVRNISKSYEAAAGKIGGSKGDLPVKKVIDDFSMDIGRGEIVGLVGPSGAGKSTMARLVMGMEKPDSGEIEFTEDVKKQMIFQDSVSAFNEHMTIEEIIAEPIVIAGKTPDGKSAGKKEALDEARKMMEQVGLGAELAKRYPYDISGGQRQRAAIARALITDPGFLVADEPISSLDVPVQSQIVHLIKTLASERGLTVLLIAHDLPMVMHVADRVEQIRILDTEKIGG